MEQRQSFGQRVLDFFMLLNSASLLALSAGAAFLLSISQLGLTFLLCIPYLVLGAFQAIFAAVSHIRQHKAVAAGQYLDGQAGFNPLRRNIHVLAIGAWLVAVCMVFVPSLLPTTANKIRRRDSHFLVQNFQDHRQEIEQLRLDLLHAHGVPPWKKLSGANFHWDGMSNVYKDGRIDIELFQEPQGFNGQIFVGYAKIGKMPIDFEWDGLNDGTAGEVVKDIEKDQSKQWVEYQALGDGWYIYYWSS